MTTLQDREKMYDEQIQFLQANPEEIDNQWREAIGLFVFVHPEIVKTATIPKECGCLSMIRSQQIYGSYAYGKSQLSDPELTQQILTDERIPKRPDDIRVEHLPVFKEWQLRLDKEIRGFTDDKETQSILA